MNTQTPLKRTPLYDLHTDLGAKMVPFAGYEMPVQYQLGVLSEHLYTRQKAGLFDVSHMGQAVIRPRSGETEFSELATVLEKIVPGDIASLAPGEMRYTLLLAESGGILDDLMVTRLAGEAANQAMLVVNAAMKEQDFALLEDLFAGTSFEVDILESQALIALQGPSAAQVLSAHLPQVNDLTFMQSVAADLAGGPVHVSRSGYTGEDGFEISLPASAASAFAQSLLRTNEVEPIGLGARDSLRLEAGLCLYGHDLSPDINPVEANLKWTVAKRRRGERSFAGADRIMAAFEQGVKRQRVGLLPTGKAPIREGTSLFFDGVEIGTVTSGGFGPSVGGPVAMGYVQSDLSSNGTELMAMVRGKERPVVVSPMPFVPHRYQRT